ncbi:MAG: hypothetical protein BSOLF_0670 [Candidatus Carbobacillus altaicus]|uniref:Uncharacterized protein n=1 Tax=Candidatus Carbonibacillus altaicus TaxID=2163959 RepID=A0A2R6Y567_9BACL|nr:MAG: hypothetical protein BSOLF_0670 [Candidatus Carbobacillus altaicus]
MRHSACGMLFISVDAQTDKPKKATQAIAQAAWRLTSG